MNNPMEQFEHIVDSHHGIYSAKVFAESFAFEQLEGISLEDYNTLLAGPDNEFYTEVWAELENITVIVDTKRYSVYQNEGIYLYPEGLDILPEIE
jgi:hypothetical protein